MKRLLLLLVMVAPMIATAQRKSFTPKPVKDTARLVLGPAVILQKPFLRYDKEAHRGRWIQKSAYFGGSRAAFGGNYDAFFGGFQYDKLGFGEVGFMSYRGDRLRNSRLHFPARMSATFAFNRTYNVYGIHFTASEPILKLEKGFYTYDLLSVGASVRLYNDGDVTSRSLMPVVSVSPPGRFINNFEFQYGYNWRFSGSEIQYLNKKHVFSVYYIFPNY